VPASQHERADGKDEGLRPQDGGGHDRHGIDDVQGDSLEEIPFFSDAVVIARVSIHDAARSQRYGIQPAFK
jgi:hypothetical protein